MRLDKIKQHEEEVETQRIQLIKEKETKVLMRIQDQRSSLDNYIAERREVWRLKASHAKNNASIGCRSLCISLLEITCSDTMILG